MSTLADSIAAGGRVVGHDRSDPVEIIDYDPLWPARFEEMRARLAAALGLTALRIDHVGSTAVPGLPAKPVIDIQVSVQNVEVETTFRAPIEELGFELRWVEIHHRYFRPPPGIPRQHQVHVCGSGSKWERVHLLFRDYLRSHPDVAAAYAALKRQLADIHRWQRVGYNDAKGPFIEAAVDQAERWAAETGWRP